MTIVVRSLDCPGTIAAMIAIVNRHALLTDGARQQALDEIARGLNNIEAIIARHKLAPLLEGTIPPVPPRHQPDEDDADLDSDLVDDDGETDDLPANTPAPQRLSPAQERVLRYIRTNPNCTVVQINKTLEIGTATLFTHLTAIRKAGYLVIGTGKPARYHVNETAPAHG